MASSVSVPTSPTASTYRRESYDSNNSESYFSQTYVPLSNLPTPPLSLHSSNSSRDNIPIMDLDNDLDPSLLGPACYLRNLIPSAASLLDSDVQTIHSILASAALPLPIVALAACILDSLNSRFALSWRNSFPLTNFESPLHQQLHIDSVRPEVIILAALIISVKFLDDQPSTTRLYSQYWGSRRWSCDQINATEQLIMENLNYRLLPLWTEELISDAVEEMQRAGRYAMRRVKHTLLQIPELDLKTIFTGKAVWSAERQLTPAVTPLSENMRGTVDLAPDTVQAFTDGHSLKSQNMVFPTRAVGETFPLYTEPFFGS